MKIVSLNTEKRKKMNYEIVIFVVAPMIQSE